MVEIKDMAMNDPPGPSRIKPVLSGMKSTSKDNDDQSNRPKKLLGCIQREADPMELMDKILSTPVQGINI